MDFTAPFFIKFTVTHVLWTSSIQDFIERTKVLENTDKILFKPFNNVWVSLHRFSRHSQVRSGITWSSVPNFTKIGQKYGKCVLKIVYAIKWNIFVTDIHETRTFSTKCVKNSDSKFHKNQTNGLAADARHTWAVGRGLSMRLCF
jgi:hypothetical protein